MLLVATFLQNDIIMRLHRSFKVNFPVSGAKSVQLYPKQMNVNVVMLYYFDCSMFRDSSEMKCERH